MSAERAEESPQDFGLAGFRMRAVQLPYAHRMTLHPARSLVVCALVASLAGCAETNTRGEEAYEWTAEVEILGSQRPRLSTGYPPAIIVLGEVFVVAYDTRAIADGTPGVAMSSFDWDGNLLVNQVDLMSATTGPGLSVNALAAVAGEDATWSLYWTTDNGLLGSLRASARGEILRAAEFITVGALRRYHIEVVEAEGQTALLLILFETNQHALVPLEPDGSLGVPRIFESWPAPITAYDPVAHRGRAVVAWSERLATSDDVVFATTADWSTGLGDPPRERFRAEDAEVTGLFIANDAPWLEVTTFASSALINLDEDTPPFTFMTGPNVGSQWLARETEVLAITSESEEMWEAPTNLVFRRLDLRTQTVLERTPVVEGDCFVEHFDVAMGGALGVVWMQGCGFRTLHARVRRPR